ncbi:MAG: response regulator transcription factor [Candidatus Sericytochromatia bacterium]|nr:response regulator transcription factor [Candidatus Sericytochromatia bacterium]
MAEKTRILIADDHAVVLAGLSAILSLEPDFDLVGQARDGDEAVRLALVSRPDVVVLDLQMPKLDGFQALARLRAHLPETQVLILTSLDDEASIYRVLQAGGSGYVLKKAAEVELVGAVREVRRGGAFIRPQYEAHLAADFLERLEAGGADPQTFERLTPREREILGFVAKGLTNQQIASHLVISVRTVETHRAHLMDKLGFKKRSELVDYAIRKGFLT